MRRAAILTAVLMMMAVTAEAKKNEPVKTAKKDAVETEVAERLKEVAKKHYESGREAYDRRDYETALREFTAAREITKRSNFDFNIALTYEHLQRYEEAIKEYYQFLTEQPDDLETRKKIAKLLNLLSEAKAEKICKRKQDEETPLPTPTKVVIVTPVLPPAPVAPAAVPAGAPTPGIAPPRNVLAPKPEAASTDENPYLGPTILGVLTGIIGITGAALTLSVSSELHRYQDRFAACPTCDFRPQIRELDVRLDWGYAFLGLGAAGLIATTIYAVAVRPKSTERQTLWIAPAGTGLALGGTF